MSISLKSSLPIFDILDSVYLIAAALSPSIEPVTHNGYIKRTSLSTYRSQRRGGRGVQGASSREEDFVEHLFVANTHSYILFFTDKDNKMKNLMKSIDSTNYKYGRSTLSLADAGIKKKWNLRKEHSSKIDTADFYCLPTIKAS